MKYLCLICAETVMEHMTLEVAEQQFAEYAAFTRAIRDNGRFLDCNRLLPANTATTLRVRNGKVSSTDGPFAETKEQLGGFYMLNCDNLDDAIEMAAKIPGARSGSIEIRPIMEFE